MQYALTDVEQCAGADIKSGLAALHKLNKTIQAVTFAACNHFTLADIALLSVLKGRINKWTAEERTALCSICRWYDFIQHLPTIANTLPTDYRVEFVLDLPKPTTKTGIKNKKTNEDSASPDAAASTPPAEASAKKTTAGGDKKAATGDNKKAAAGGDKKKGAAQPQEAESSEAAGPDALLHRVDFRVGRIVECEKHPDADTLYVEKIDLGESSGPRTIVSGLVKFVPLEQMLNRLVVVVANLKPSKLKGIMSAGMVLAASNDDHTQVEILDPPANATPGERITFQGVTGEADAQLNPKKKIFEEIKPFLTTDAQRVAHFKSLAFTTSAGPCTVATLANAKLG